MYPRKRDDVCKQNALYIYAPTIFKQRASFHTLITASSRVKRISYSNLQTTALFHSGFESPFGSFHSCWQPAALYTHRHGRHTVGGDATVTPRDAS